MWPPCKNNIPVPIRVLRSAADVCNHHIYRELSSDADGLCNHGLIIGCTSNTLDGFVLDDNGHDA